VPASEEEEAFLAAHDRDALPRVGVTVDVVLLTIRNGRLTVLLVERGGHPYKGAWALPGGFVREDEDLDAAALRALADETGVATFPGHLEQLRAYGAPDRDPRLRVVSCAYVGFVPGLPAPEPGSDATAARYWDVADLGALEGPDLAFDHDRIIAEALERAQAKLEYTPLATRFTEEPFTLAELRRVYEAVWGTPLHPGNFRRKVLSVPGFVTPLGTRTPAGARGRPAELYRCGDATLLHPAMLRPAIDASDVEDGGLAVGPRGPALPSPGAAAT
jgi:8-oxo-dGTP diphosphatase